jgi:hypothetical protein
MAVMLAVTIAASACAPDESSVGAVAPGQPGLAAAYFDGRGFDHPSGVYHDANIDFDGWELNARVEARGHVAHTLSIRWTGQIELDRAEPATLSFETRGRVRLWIDDALVIDDWVDSDVVRRARGSVPGAGSAWRDLRVEWDQVDGPMVARLRMSSASRPEAIVPESGLRAP